MKTSNMKKNLNARAFLTAWPGIFNRVFIWFGLLCMLFLLTAMQAKAQYTAVRCASTDNTFGNVTYIDSYFTNNNPDVVLIVTHYWNPGVYNNHNVGVWYDRWRGQWAVFNQDRSPMPLNACFAVAEYFPAHGRALTHIANSSNTSGHITYIDSTLTNGLSGKKLFVTSKYNPNNRYNDHPIGVWYDDWRGQWAIFNQDRGTMVDGTAFNVVVEEEVPSWVYTHIATQANTFLTYTVLDSLPGGPIVITANFNPNGVYCNFVPGVSLNGSNYSIFNENAAGPGPILLDRARIPIGAAFNVLVAPPG